MRRFDAEMVDDDSAEIALESTDSELLKKFSLKSKEGEEYEALKLKKYTTWKTKMGEWKKKEKKAKAKFKADKATRIKELQESYKGATEKVEKARLEEELAIAKTTYYQPTTPPFPASDVTIQQQLDYLAKDEYIPKPYDTEALTELIESNNALKASIGVKATTTTGLGQQYRPTNGQNVADFDKATLEEYYRQGKELLSWYDSKVEQGKKFYQIATGVNNSRNGVGEGYFEIVDNNLGQISQILYMPSVNVWEGRARDRYIYIQNGVKKYYKKFNDKKVRHEDTFKEGAPLAKRANRLLPLKQFNLVSIVYGTPEWAGTIPEVLGRRYSAELNVNYFSNSGIPKMVIMVSGGAVGKETTAKVREFFRGKNKDRANAGRVLVMTVSNKNPLSPNAKPPVVSFEKLIDREEDGHFMKYADACDASVLRAFKISANFLGDSASSNRASSYTLRDLITQSVILPEGEEVANLCNDTFTFEFAEEKKYIVIDKNGKITKNNLLAELQFVPIQTMSQKDMAELQLAQLNSGALTVDEFRAQVLGLPKLGSWLGSVSKTIAISMLQLSETSPTLVASLLDDPELASAIKADMKADKIEETIDENKTIDSTVKALLYMRKGLNEVLTHKHVEKETVRNVENFFTGLVKMSDEEDRAAINNLFKKDSEV